MYERIESGEILDLLSTLFSAAAVRTKFLNLRRTESSSINEVLNIPLVPENSAYYDAKGTIIEAAERIIDLVRGPRDVLVDLSFQHCASATLQVVLRYKIAHHVPLSGSTTYPAISDAVGNCLTQALLERVIQHAMSFGLFAQTASGEVAHTSVSALLVNDPDLEAWLYLCSNVAYPAGAQLPKAFDQYGVSSEANEAAYSVSIGRKVGQFEHFREPDGRNEFEIFAKAMKGISAGGSYDVRHVVYGGYPWHTLEQGGSSLVVDVGGGPGHVAIALARKFPRLRFEVQDLPETVEVGARSCPEDLKSRFTFRAHDFFKTQPDHSLSENECVAYFARFILHDWSDKYALRILEPLAKALRPQDRVILNEVIVPEPGEMPREIERRLHDRDILMLMNLNGRERTKSAFEAMMREVTPRLRVSQVYTPPQGELSLIELVLDC